MKQQDLEPINEQLRGAVVEEFVDNPDGAVILSFRGNTPDLLIRLADVDEPERPMRYLP